MVVGSSIGRSVATGVSMVVGSPSSICGISIGASTIVVVVPVGTKTVVGGVDGVVGMVVGITDVVVVSCSVVVVCG